MQTQWLTARSKNGNSGTRREQPGDERCRPEHVLEVIQHQQQMLAGQKPRDRLICGLASERDDLQGVDHRRGNILRSLKGRQRHELRTVREVGFDGSADLEREPRLAHAAGSGEREQPRRGLEPLAHAREPRVRDRSSDSVAPATGDRQTAAPTLMRRSRRWRALQATAAARQ